MRHGTGSGGLRGVWLSRREMRMHVHIGLGLIHAGESSGAVIVAVVGAEAIFRIQRQSVGTQLRRRGTVGFRDRGTRQAGTGARGCALLINAAGGLGRRREAEGGELVARQQRTFGRVVVIPRGVSRTAGVDLRNRRQLQLFGFTGNNWKM